MFCLVLGLRVLDVGWSLCCCMCLCCVRCGVLFVSVCQCWCFLFVMCFPAMSFVGVCGFVGCMMCVCARLCVFGEWFCLGF